MTRSSAPNLDGQSFGKWTISSLIGEGGFAWVYKGREPVLERDVAIKILQPLPEGGYLDETRERFLLEARMTAHLRDQHTLSVYSVGEEEIDGETYLYFVSEYVDGPTLGDYLERHGALNPLDLVIVLKQIAKSLHEAHTHEESPFIHRDLKCANVMISKSDSMRASGLFVKVVDYGIGKALRAGTSFDKNLTTQGEFNLSVFYAAPEQIKSPERLGAWTDLYALGIVAYECLTGHHPYHGKSQSFALAQVIADECITLPPAYQDGPLAPIITKLLQKKIEERYQDCDELIADLNRLETEEARAARQTFQENLDLAPSHWDTQDVQAKAARLAKREDGATQQMEEGSFDPVDDYKTLPFHRQKLPATPEGLHTPSTHDAGLPLTSREPPIGSVETEKSLTPGPSSRSLVLAILMLLLLGGGVMGAILMTLDTSPIQKTSPHATPVHTESPAPKPGETPIDLALATEAAVHRVSRGYERARFVMKVTADALESRDKDSDKTSAPKQTSRQKPSSPTAKRLDRHARDTKTTTAPEVIEEHAQTPPAAVVDKNATTPSPAPKTTSASLPEEETKEFRFFGVP